MRSVQFLVIFILVPVLAWTRADAFAADSPAAAPAAVVADTPKDAGAAVPADAQKGAREGGAKDAAKDAAKDGAAPLAGDEVLVSAQRVERSTEDRIVVGEGAVVIRHKDMRLAADRIVYHEESRDVIADGNVVLDSGADRLQGSHLELNLGTRIGFMDNAQGFIQTYYFTGKRIEKRGPDRYFLRNGTFTTCEGVLPDWSFHATSTDVTIDEYIHAWNPNLRVKRLPLLYAPYAIFPIKRDRSTGLLIPGLNYTERDGFVVRNAFYWAPRDNFDATIGLDYLQKTGWGADAEMRYLLAPRTQGEMNATYVRDDNAGSALGQRWSVSTRNSHELPLGMHLEAEAFFQSDRQYTATYGDTIEQRSNERTSSSFYLSRSWSAWDFALTGRLEESLLTERRTTLTRFPELTINRTSTRLFDSQLFLKVNAAGVHLDRESPDADVATTRLHVAPELTWPIPIGTVARILPTATYALTWYSPDLNGEEETRGIPTYRLSLEGPRPYRIWDLSGGRIEKIKHLIEPRISYVHTPTVDQKHLPQFDSIDRIAPANRLEYSLTNTLYGKVREQRVKPVKSVKADDADGAGGANKADDADKADDVDDVDQADDVKADDVGKADKADAPGKADKPAAPVTSTQELLWVKLSQRYAIDVDTPEVVVPADAEPDHPFSAIDWELRTRPPGSGFELWWRGDLDVYGKGIGHQNVSLTWNPSPRLALRGEWRTSRDSNQDFLDLGGELTLGRFLLEGRSRFNLAEDTFVENRASVKYTTQCWDVTLGYVRWTDTYEYQLLISLKGIGTVLKI